MQRNCEHGNLCLACEGEEQAILKVLRETYHKAQCLNAKLIARAALDAALFEALREHN